VLQIAYKLEKGEVRNNIIPFTSSFTMYIYHAYARYGYFSFYTSVTSWKLFLEKIVVIVQALTYILSVTNFFIIYIHMHMQDVGVFLSTQGAELGTLSGRHCNRSTGAPLGEYLR